MGTRLRLFALFTTILASLASCGDDGNSDGIECILNSHCDRYDGGVCVTAPSGRRWCAYPDSECESQLRYDEKDVGDGLAGMCVPASAADAGVDAAVDATVDAIDAPPADAGMTCATSADCLPGNYCHFTECSPCSDLSVLGFNPPENLATVNTAGNDYNISLSGDGTRLYVVQSGGINEYPIDSEGNIGTGTALQIPSTPGSIARLRVATADQITFYLSERISGGIASIWQSTWNGAAFSTPVEVTELNDPKEDSGFMSVTMDGKTIYFSSDRPVTGDPIQDDNIWTSTLNGATWSTPTRLTTISTNNQESAPTVNGDALIYTSSSSGFNQMLQLSTPVGDPPVPLSDVNQAGSDTSFGVFTPDRCTLYFVSNRSGGVGNFDVWRATRR